jgi:chromosome segregation ATPase
VSSLAWLAWPFAMTSASAASRVSRETHVAAFFSYRIVFEALDAQLDRLGMEIDQMKAHTDDLQRQYDAAGAEADRLTAALNELKSRDQVQTMVAQQNVAVDRANDFARRLVAAVAETNARIETHNNLVLDDQQRIEPLEPITVS